MPEPLFSGESEIIWKKEDGPEAWAEIMDKIVNEEAAEISPKPFLTENPFMNLPPEPAPVPVQAPAPVPSTLPPCGDAACKRSHRPSGAHYSDDREIRMTELQADGKMGPQFGKLGPVAKTKKRLTESVVEAAREMADDVIEAFKDGIDPSQPIGIRLAAAEKILKVDQADIARESAEKQAALEGMNKEQLVGSILESLSRLGGAAAIAREIDEQITDAEVISE